MNHDQERMRARLFVLMLGALLIVGWAVVNTLLIWFGPRLIATVSSGLLVLSGIALLVLLVSTMRLRRARDRRST